MPGPAGPSPKLLGRIAAVLLAGIFVAIVWWAVSRNPAPTPSGPGPINTDEIPDITDIETGESIVITLADRNDPGRVAGVIEADRFDPVGNGERLLTNPRAWLYPSGGRAVRVTAERARLVMPSANQSPESGTLEGNVRVLVYEHDAAPGDPPPADAAPMLTGTFEAPVRFESRYLRLSSDGPFSLIGERLRFQGADLSVLLNQVRDRVELIEITRGGRLEFLPTASDRTEPSPTQGEPMATIDPAGPTPIGETPAAIAGTPPATPGTATPKIDLYHAILSEEVVVSMGTARAEGDRLELFARTTDNQLPSDSLARVGFARTAPVQEIPQAAPRPATPTTPGTTTTSDDTAAAEPIDLSPPIAQAPTPDTTLTVIWQGSMAIRPVEQTPAELTEDDAALAMFGADAPVRFEDPARGATGSAKSVRYAASRAVLSLESGDEPVRVAIEDAGEGAFTRVDADLRSGIIRLPGRGSARSRTDAALRWSDSAHLTLAVRDDQLTDRLTEATFTGEVLATQQDAILAGESLETVFSAGSDGRSALRVATVTAGGFTGAADDLGSPQSLFADLIRVDFVGDAGKPEPVRIAATGEVIGKANGAELSADRATATLARNGLGDLFVRTADASGAIVYRDSENTTASGSRLAVDGARETLRLSGEQNAPASATRGDSSLTGPAIDLDARNRRMSVTGVGRFEHRLRDNAGAETGRVIADWTDSMRFDDALGRLLCEGGVSVVSTPDAYTRDTLKAARIEVEMTPRLTPDRVGGRGTSERQVTIARAYGGSSDSGPAPATAETRTYDPANPERVTGLLYLESDQIVADNQRAQLRVPGAGTLLVLDRREENQAGAGTDGIGNSLGPGLTRFNWGQSMTLDRPAGIGEMRGDVRVVHKTIAKGAGSEQLAYLDCDELTARFGQLTRDTGAEDRFALDTADARGRVSFRAGGKTLSADGARYEAARSVLYTLAAPGNMVTLTEPGRAAPLSARAISWDLARDLIEINRPSPVVLPGN